jgi:hypothetical protein
MMFVALAMLLNNLPATQEFYHKFLTTHLSISIENIFSFSIDIEKFINDGLMVVFFFVVMSAIAAMIVTAAAAMFVMMVMSASAAVVMTAMAMVIMVFFSGMDFHTIFHRSGEGGQFRNQSLRILGGQPQLAGGEGDHRFLHFGKGIHFMFDLGSAVGAVQIFHDVNSGEHSITS